MEFPSWQVFKEKLSLFQQKAQAGIQEFKKKNPIAASIIESAFDFLPPPFNSIAEKIFNSTEGTAEDKIGSVIKYLNDLESKGEQHYIDITSRLDKVLAAVVDIRTITAKESTLQSIKEIMLANNSQANIMTTDLKIELEGMDKTLENVNSKLDILLRVTRLTNTFSQITENRLRPDQQEIEVSPTPPKIVMPDTQGNIINLKQGDRSVLSIKYDTLVKLSEPDELALNTYHKNMLNYQKILLTIEGELPTVIDARQKAIYMNDIAELTEKMCKEFNKVNKILKLVGLDLTNSYTNIVEICR
jgi:hypothetical protein